MLLKIKKLNIFSKCSNRVFQGPFVVVCVWKFLIQGGGISPKSKLFVIIDGIESEILLFADDTCCFATGIDPAETAMPFNRDLEKLKIQASRRKVTFNPSKSKEIYKLFLFLFVQKLAPRIYSYFYLREKLLFADHWGVRRLSTKCG